MKDLLTVTEIETAEIRLLRLVQLESFSGEENKRLSRLKTFVDSLGTMRLITKLWARQDTEDFRAPIILPGDHHLVEKLILEEHIRNCYLKGLGLLNHLREKYWILRGRQAIRKALKTCVACQRFYSRKFEEDSPPSPENRVRDAKVFEITGTDFVGPLYLRNGEKVWICIFTCAVYRAIHLDLFLLYRLNNL